MKKTQKTWLIVISAGILLSLIGVLVWNQMQLQSELTGFKSTSATTFNFEVIDEQVGNATKASNLVNITLYERDTTGLTSKQIAASKFADYTVKGVYADGDIVTFDADHIYYYIATGTGFVNVSMVPTPGLNLIKMLNMTQDVAGLFYADETLSTTINQTNYLTWNCIAQTLDADNEMTTLEGYKTNYDFENDVTKYVILRVQYNTTAKESWSVFNDAGYTTDESTSGNYTYYLIDHKLVGQAVYSIEFSTDLGTAFEVIGMSLRYGTVDSNTEWYAQN